jgi:hypothetical protein
VKRLLIRVAAGLLIVPVVVLWGIALLLCAPMFGMFALITSGWEMSVAWAELKEVYGEMTGYAKWRKRAQQQKLAKMSQLERMVYMEDLLR